MDKDKLKQKFIRGNKKAFDQIYNDYSSAMYFLCLRYTKNTDEASDIMQDAFLKIYEKRKQFNPEKDLSAWIKRIVINTAIDQYKKNKKTVLINDNSFFEAEAEENELEFDYNGSKEILLKALQELSTGYRTIFNLYVFENLTHAEISTFLNISIGNSKSQLSRARKALQKVLELNNSIKTKLVK